MAQSSACKGELSHLPAGPSARLVFLLLGLLVRPWPRRLLPAVATANTTGTFSKNLEYEDHVEHVDKEEHYVDGAEGDPAEA